MAHLARNSVTAVVRTIQNCGRHRFSLRLVVALALISSTAHIIRAQSPPYGLRERVPNTSFLITTSSDLTQMQPRGVFANLSFARAVFLTHAGDGSDRIFVVEQAGTIKVFPNRDDADAARTFLDIRSQVNSGPNEAGLLSVAFHPHYATNGRFFIYYNHGNLISRVSEFQVSNDPDSADVNSERILFEEPQPAGNHNGGQVAFGPDGYLYIGLGDGGGANDTFENGQDPTTLLGTILRIDIDGNPEGGATYGIPADNPFVGNDDGWREEIWAWGLRNPWRFSFDRLNGTLWTGDVGQRRREEVDLIEKGGNYGWNTMEGFECFRPPTDCDQEGLALPIVEYSPAEGRSITGGFVYRGPRLARLAGVYIYGDFVSRRIWGLKYEQGQVIENELIAVSPTSIASFGEDEAGEVYVVGLDGRIYVLDESPDAEPPGTIPETLSGSGLFVDTAARIPSPGVIPYSVNSELWSDGAAKTRFIALPGTEQIAFSREGFWDFPPNTIIVKNFFIELEQGDRSSRRIVETRFLVKRSDGSSWDGFSYMWNDGGTDANLLEGARRQTFTIADPDAPGGEFEREHYFPSREDCITCHTPAAGHVLGVRTLQMNKTHEYGDAVDNQLRSLNHIGIFTADIGEDYSEFPRLPDPLDAQVDLRRRARSYLDANCAQCHLPGGTGLSNIDLRFSTPLAETNLVGVPPTLSDLGVDEAERLKPGAPDSSVLYLRMLDLGMFRMPQLATSRVDEQGSEVIRGWIEILGTPTHIEMTDAALPIAFSLEQNFPNPFNAHTVIRFALPLPSRVELEVFDVLGQRVALLTEGRLERGHYRVSLDAADLSSGLYFYRMRSGDFVAVRKMALVK